VGKRKHEEPGKPGRPTVLNPKLEAELLRLLSDAVSRRTACIRCGIGLSTFRDWMAKGKAEPQSEWGRFRHKVREAEAEAEIEVVRHIQEKALENAWLGMEWLKLRHPKRFNPKTKVELSGDLR
jgi:transposase